MALLPSCDITTFDAFLQPECPIKLQDRVGRPASVDYAINLKGGNQLLKCIPIEAKRMFTALHLKTALLVHQQTVNVREFQR